MLVECSTVVCIKVFLQRQHFDGQMAASPNTGGALTATCRAEYSISLFIVAAKTCHTTELVMVIYWL